MAGATSAPSPRSVTIEAGQLRDLVTQLVHEALPASTSAVEPGDAFAAAVPMDAIALPSADDTPGSGTVGRGIAYTGDRGPAVSSTLRQKIIDHKFVDLGALLDSPDQFHDIPSPAFQLVDGVLRAAPCSARPISSFGTWSSFFVLRQFIWRVTPVMR